MQLFSYIKLDIGYVMPNLWVVIIYHHGSCSFYILQYWLLTYTRSLRISGHCTDLDSGSMVRASHSGLFMAAL